MDYKKIGLISGIEIHAQLEGKKLFANTPTQIREDTPHYEISRRLRAVVGETGEIDDAAAAEGKKSKEFVYQGYTDTISLIELDEEPPTPMNEGALNLALQMCTYFNTKIIDEVQVMRKTVVDGSNTSGFQRTSLVGINGSIEVYGKKVGIQTICLEEDACKIVERTHTKDTYNLSRLGIPLIEIATDPDLKTPLEVQACAKKIGMFLRSLTPVYGQSIKRGLGTIRQDVNVSIKGGARVEIKGAQDLKMIPTLVDNEILRQQKLIELSKRFKKSKIDGTIVDITDILKNTACPFVKKTIDSKGVAFAVKIEGFAGVLGEAVCPERRVGSEISDYGKLAGGVGGLIHSDEDPKKYKFTETEVTAIRNKLECNTTDAYIIVADTESKVYAALTGAINRVRRLSEGVIKEVRKANDDGTTTYMRPMPGGSRMYPETDVMPIIPPKNVIVGPTIEEKAESLISAGLKNEDLAHTVAMDADTILTLVRKTGADINSVASNLVLAEDIPLKNLEEIFTAIHTGTIPANAFESIITEIRKGISVTKAITLKKSMPRHEVEKIIDDVLKTMSDEKHLGKIMGRVMAASQGKADGKIVMEILKEKL